MMQVTVYQVVDVLAVGHSFMTAAFAVDVALSVAGARMVWGTGLGVRRADGEQAFVDVAVVGVMQVPVVEVVDVVVMSNGGVATRRSMNVTMVGVGLVGHA